jgi:integrase
MTRKRRHAGTYEVEPGVFKIVVSLGQDATGRYRQTSRTMRGTLKDAKAARARLVTEAVDGRVVAHSSATFGALLDRWLEHVQTLDRSPTTIRGYQSAVEVHLKPALGSKPVGKITTLDLDRLYQRLGATRQAATTRKVHQAARSALTQAVRWRLVGRNVALDASAPPIRRAPATAISLDDLHRLIDAADSEFQTLLVLAATTGMRRGELCGLVWEALELPEERPGAVEVRQVVIHGLDDRALVRASTKTGRTRRISLDEGTVALLREHRSRCEESLRECGGESLGPFVFAPEPGNYRPYQPHSISRRFTRLCARVGIERVTLHQATRHFAATQLIAAGVDIRTVAGRLGHSRASVTLDVYSHLLAERDEDAAGVLGAIVTRRNRAGRDCET